jgi:hypothetical protein
MKPSWLPNWKDPTKYPDQAKTSRLDWAWQFLKRNPVYQQLWLRLIAPNYDPAHVDRSLQRTPASAQAVSDRVRPILKDCPPSALVGQIRQIEEGSVSGSS